MPWLHRRIFAIRATAVTGNPGHIWPIFVYRYNPGDDFELLDSTNQLHVQGGADSATWLLQLPHTVSVMLLAKTVAKSHKIFCPHYADQTLTTSSVLDGVSAVGHERWCRVEVAQWPKRSYCQWDVRQLRR